MREKEYRKYFEGLFREHTGPVVPRPEAPEENMTDRDKAQLRLHLLTRALTQYKGLIFEPDETEQRPENLDEQVDNIMAIIAERSAERETENNRPGPDEKKTNGEMNRDESCEPRPAGENEVDDAGHNGKIILFSRWQRVITAAAAAAVLIVVLWLAHFTPDEPPPTPVERKQVAYLLDIQEQIRLLRPDESGKIPGKILKQDPASVVLYSQDEISVPEGGAAKVIFPGSVYILSEGNHFRVREDALERQEQGSWHAQRPVMSTPDAEDALAILEAERIALPPDRMFAQITPRDVRAVEPKVTVLSPRGRTLSQTPTFIWEDPSEKDDPVYELAIALLDEIGEPAAASSWHETGQQKFSWDETGWPDAQRGQQYMVYIRRNGELLTDGSFRFHIMSQQDAEALGERLSTIKETLPEGRARLFLKANLLMSERWRCHAEARMKAETLVSSAPGDVTYLKLLQHCYQALDLSEKVREVQRRLDALDK